MYLHLKVYSSTKDIGSSYFKMSLKGLSMFIDVNSSFKGISYFLFWECLCPFKYPSNQHFIVSFPVTMGTHIGKPIEIFQSKFKENYQMSYRLVCKVLITMSLSTFKMSSCERCHTWGDWYQILQLDPLWFLGILFSKDMKQWH